MKNARNNEFSDRRAVAADAKTALLNAYRAAKAAAEPTNLARQAERMPGPHVPCAKPAPTFRSPRLARLTDPRHPGRYPPQAFRSGLSRPGLHADGRSRPIRSKGPYAQFMEHRKGRLKCGYLADIVVLFHDIEEMQADVLQEVAPPLTICGGKVSYRRSA